jgi:hypothetical protein
MILCLLLREGWEVFFSPLVCDARWDPKPTCNNQRVSLPCVAGGGCCVVHASFFGGAMSRESLVKLDSEACLLQSAPPTVCYAE